MEIISLKDRSKLEIAGFCLALLSIGALVGGKIEKQKDSDETNRIINTIRPIRENNFNYKFIFPLLSYDFAESNKYFENTELTTQIKRQIANEIQSKNAKKISVYVRNFLNNRWAGADADTQYQPGSMLKVLIMMAYYRQAQLDPQILNKTFAYIPAIDKEVRSLNFSTQSVLQVGQNYGVKELMEYMIADSDNGAENLLIDNIDKKILNDAYNDLNIQNPDTAKGTYTISARQYLSFLRILFNSTYLSEAYSEEALSIMAQSNYKDGLVAGLPADVISAHKYGERVSEDGQRIDLSDCGIVYAQSGPYSICIMTNGNNEKKQAEAIKNISKIIYERLK